MIYLDHAATTKISPKALEVFTQTSKQFFYNTESLHDGGNDSKSLLEHARSQFAALVGKESEGIYFTGGGSDGNFLSLTALAYGAITKGRHIISTTIEHPSVEYTLDYLEQQGFFITRIPVDPHGQLNIDQVKKHLRPDTILATVQHVNSETGITQDIRRLGEYFRANGIYFHSDCVQSFTKFDQHQFQEIPIDAFTVSSHKIHGPKGTGAVYISPSIHISPLLFGVTHERGFKPGTVDLPSITAFVTAAEESYHYQPEWTDHVINMRNLFLSLILKDNLIVYEGTKDSSPYIIPVRLIGIEGQIVMQELNRKHIYVSTGSACKNGQQAPSKALLAKGRSDNEAHELVRISIDHSTDPKDIKKLYVELTHITSNYRTNRETIIT